MEDHESVSSSSTSSENSKQSSVDTMSSGYDSEVNTIAEEFARQCSISHVTTNTIHLEQESIQVDISPSEIRGLNRTIALNEQDNVSSFLSRGSILYNSIILDQQYDSSSSSTSSSSKRILHSSSKSDANENSHQNNISTTSNYEDRLATSIHCEEDPNANNTQSIHEALYETQRDIQIENPTGSGNAHPIGFEDGIYMSPVRGDVGNDVITDIDFSPNDLMDHMDDLVKVKLGSQILQIIATHGHGSRKVIHLLACLCHVCKSKEEAETLIKSTISAMSDESEKRDAMKRYGKGISNDKWTAAGMHLREHGAGIPNPESKIVHHRRRIDESTIQDFVEWLNAGDFLQNLAFGEKTVKISNGFHVAIESIKRTRSVTDIIRKYYSDFMDGSEDTDGDDMLDNMEDDIIDNENQYSDEEDDDDDNDDHHQGKFYNTLNVLLFDSSLSNTIFCICIQRRVSINDVIINARNQDYDVFAEKIILEDTSLLHRIS